MKKKLTCIFHQFSPNQIAKYRELSSFGNFTDMKRIWQDFKWVDIYRIVGDINGFSTEKKPVLLEAYLYVDYSGSPALRKAALNSSLFGPVDAFPHFSTENLGFILSTSAASARASSSRPDLL